MSRFVLHNVRLFAGGADLTTNANKTELSMEVEEKDTTSFTPTGQVWHESLGGISSASISGSGQWDAQSTPATGPLLPDDGSFSFVGAVQAVTVCPSTAADGSIAYVGGFLRQNYVLGGSVGDVAPWTGMWQGNWPIGRGVVLAAPTVRTTTGTGTIIGPLPALGATDVLIGTLHVMSLAGTTPSVTATVQSAASVGFASPTTRLTFNAASSIGGQVFRIVGPITDTYWRLNYTISGTTPSLLFMSAMGIS
jgi:hypothetical protein